jgi:hypothetical protein
MHDALPSVDWDGDTAMSELLLVCRRHVDLQRVCSAFCPA